jgi:hypothetical protein
LIPVQPILALSCAIAENKPVTAPIRLIARTTNALVAKVFDRFIEGIASSDDVILGYSLAILLLQLELRLTLR